MKVRPGLVMYNDERFGRILLKKSSKNNKCFKNNYTFAVSCSQTIIIPIHHYEIF